MYFSKYISIQCEECQAEYVQAVWAHPMLVEHLIQPLVSIPLVLIEGLAFVTLHVRGLSLDLSFLLITGPFLLHLKIFSYIAFQSCEISYIKSKILIILFSLLILC